MGYPNTAHSGGWKVIFSNLPLLPKTTDMKLFEGYIKSVILPDYNLEEYQSGFKGETTRYPISRVNENLSQFQIDFILSEDKMNYFYLLQWMMSKRYGQTLENINRITIELLDNQRRTIGKMHYTEASLVFLSSIPLDSGVDDEITLTTNFSYEEVCFETVDVGGSS